MGALITVLALAIGMLSTPVPPTADDSACSAIPSKTDYCNPRLARWLPHDLDAFDGWRRGDARLNTPPDPFVLVRAGKSRDFPESTPVQHNVEGPATMGVFAADPVHHIVFMRTYCCGAGYQMLARTTGAAPVRLPLADLSGVRTRRGLHLGMSAREVVAKLGWTIRYRLAGRPSMTFMDYVTERKPFGPKPEVERYAGHCPYGMLIALRDDRVVSIALEQSC